MSVWKDMETIMETAPIVTILMSAITVWVTYVTKMPFVQILMVDTSVLVRKVSLVMDFSALTLTSVKIQFIIVRLLTDVSIQLAVINVHPATVRLRPK